MRKIEKMMEKTAIIEENKLKNVGKQIGNDRKSLIKKVKNYVDEKGLQIPLK